MLGGNKIPFDLNPDVTKYFNCVNDVPKIIENEYSIKKWVGKIYEVF